MRGVWLFVLLAATYAQQQSLNHQFDKLRERLHGVDSIIRNLDASDRKQVDLQIGLLASKLSNEEKQSQAYKQQREAAHAEQLYLAQKSSAADDLIQALSQATQALRVELALVTTECDEAMSRQHAVKTQREHRASIVMLLKKALLKMESTQRNSDNAEVVHQLFQEAMALAQVAQSPSSQPTASTDAGRSAEFQGLLSELSTVASVLSSPPDGQGHIDGEVIVCGMERAHVQLALSELQAQIDNVTQSQRDWYLRSDYKRRQLIASDEVQLAKDNAIVSTRTLIREIANAYQHRRNSRLQQLCEVVSLRRALADRDKVDILDAVLPGPSQYASATVPAILDLSLNCTMLSHIRPIVPPTIPERRKCKSSRLSLDGREPLPSEWADHVKEDDCDPLRVVDINTLST